MSSNVGLATPRGSGTSGYVQRNLSHLKPRSAPYPPPGSLPSSSLSSAGPRVRKPDQSILLHAKKREIEVSCLTLRDALEEAGALNEDEIDERVDELRKKLTEELELGWSADGDGGGGGTAGGKGLKAHQVHELAEAKMAENKRMERALGIASDYEEVGGSIFFLLGEQDWECGY